LAFPARPPRPWPSPAGPSRTSRVRRPAPEQVPAGSTPVSFTSPSKRPRNGRSHSTARIRRSRRAKGPSSHEVRPLRAPSPLHRSRVHSPSPEGRVRAGAARRRRRVPPSWSLTTSTVSSAREAAGLLHPAHGHGVHRVSRRRMPVRRPASRTTLPAAGLAPYEEFPSPAAVPRHRGRFPLAVTRPDGACDASQDTRCQVPQPTSPHQGGRLQGFAPLTNPLRPTTVSSSWGARSFHGLGSPSRHHRAPPATRRRHNPCGG
jgi:hypothetical protein